MGNKTQLQLNNETLGSILSNVLGLPSQESLKQGSYVWKKLTAEGGDFVDFTVSDSPTAYPDGGEQDGYWYEKVVEGIDLTKLTTFTEIDVSTFTLTSNSKSIQINNAFISKPKVLLIFEKSTPTGSHVGRVALLIHGEEGHYMYGGYTVMYNGINSSSSTTGISVSAYDTYVLITMSNYDFLAGIEYTVITMA